ncbi:MAG: GGDEF domain-containing protein [Christensenellaceae bacterium]|nr:GGDEF domain-containing protein [Christensenellaceae bacterium]
MANRRYNIGLLVATISDEFSKRVTIGAMEAAKQLDANMVIFPGKYVGVQHINEHYNAEYEYQYNVLFDLAAEAKLDYLIVAVGTIAYAHNNEYQKAFLDSLGDTPILSVASGIEGYDCLQFDNRSGVSAAVDYLASHGRKHIGMIAGDLSNEGFVQRYEAYREALEANGLEYKDSYMVTCGLAYRCYGEVEQLLNENPELDAIVCTTDLIAYDVYEVLKKRNIRVGVEVAVVGFDDLPGDEKLDPPLASVRADAVQIGRKAVEKAVNYLNGVQDDCHYIESQFIPRRSCFKYVDDFNISERIFCGDFSAMVDHIRDYFTKRCENATADQHSCDQIIALVEHLYQNYAQHPVDESIVEDTVAILEQAIPLREDTGIDRILYGTYVWILRNCPVSNVPYVEMLHQYFRAEKSEETAESVAKRFMERSYLDNVFIRDSLMFGGNLKHSYARIMKKIDSVGAVTAFIYTFDKPITHSYGDQFPKDLTWTFQSYSYGDDVFSLPKDKQQISTPQVFDNDFTCQNRQHIFIVADLFSAETQYGIALLEPRDETFLDELELVTYQLSSAVRTLDILKKQEKLLKELHTTNLALEKMSKIDELTSVYNRKGFYPAAQELIHDPRYQGKSFVICYADMDNLKLVNDTYGHAEGDFSIRLVADCLAHTLGDNAVIGRMGGDEFAAIVPLPEGVTVASLTSRKEAFIRRFNESKEKPYQFGVSLGMHECACQNSDDLGAALNKADDLLYIEKRNKKRGIKVRAYPRAASQTGKG